MEKNTKLAIFGLGHMGLPTAALFANSGIKVTGVARDINKLKMINEGVSPVVEPGLDKLVKEAVRSGNLFATDNGLNASKNSNIMIVVVPTPMDKYNRADLNAVKSTCRTISKGLKKNDLIIIESTIPQGTCENIVVPILEESGLNAAEDFGVAYTPERAIPSNTIYEMTHNARVIGGINKKSTNMAVSLYKNITKGEIITVKNLKTAETVKLIENTYRDVNIALANEIAMICDGLDVDAMDAINAANYHPRVNILTPGPGVGGHCLAIDPYFIVETAEENGLDANLIRTARLTNEGMPNHVTKLVIDGLNSAGIRLKNSKIGILGVAYKRNVADARETPAEPLITILEEKGATIYAHDPYSSKESIKAIGAIPISLEKILECDCTILVTDHDVYNEITPEMIKSKVFVCTRPVLNSANFKNKSFIFKGLGFF